MKTVVKISVVMAFAAASSLWFSAAAQSLYEGEEESICHWEGGLMVGFSQDGYEFELKGYYFPKEWFGLKAGIGIAGEYQPIDYLEWSDDYGFDYGFYDDDTHYAARFKFTPALVFRTPRIINWKSQDAGVYIFAEPGIVVSPGAAGSRRAKVLCWDAKAGVNVQFGPAVVSLGYGISDFSLYSGRPYNENGLPDKNNYLTHTVFISGTWKF